MGHTKSRTDSRQAEIVRSHMLKRGGSNHTVILVQFGMFDILLLNYELHPQARLSDDYNPVSVSLKWYI